MSDRNSAYGELYHGEDQGGPFGNPMLARRRFDYVDPARSARTRAALDKAYAKMEADWLVMKAGAKPCTI